MSVGGFGIGTVMFKRASSSNTSRIDSIVSTHPCQPIFLDLSMLHKTLAEHFNYIMMVNGKGIDHLIEKAHGVIKASSVGVKFWSILSKGDFVMLLCFESSLQAF